MFYVIDIFTFSKITVNERRLRFREKKVKDPISMIFDHTYSVISILADEEYLYYQSVILSDRPASYDSIP